MSKANELRETIRKIDECKVRLKESKQALITAQTFVSVEQTILEKLHETECRLRWDISEEAISE